QSERRRLRAAGQQGYAQRLERRCDPPRTGRGRRLWRPAGASAGAGAGGCAGRQDHRGLRPRTLPRRHHGRAGRPAGDRPTAQQTTGAGMMADLSRFAINQITTRDWTLEQAVDGYARAGVAGIAVWMEYLDAAG